MKAVLFRSFGGPEVLSLEEVPDPHPGAGEIRIAVHAAGVNPVDAKIRKGLLVKRIPHEWPIIPGWDVAGVVDEVGEGVTLLHKGDQVYAYGRKPVVQAGSYAEFIILPEQHVAPMPVSMDFIHASTVPLAALTAWQSLYDAAEMTSQHKVLIHAGSGGVGGFAVQLAKHTGAFVMATASKKNHAYVRRLGADMVIDYTEKDFRDAVLETFPAGIDIVFDTVGGDVQTKSTDVLSRGGTLVSILAFVDEEKVIQAGCKPKYVFVAPNRQQLIEVGSLIDSGKLVSEVSATLPLEQSAEAHRRIESQRTVGKMALGIRV